jgi:hypothetical protein
LQDGVAEYYQSKGKMPASTDEAGCSDKGTANSSSPSVGAGGIITVNATCTLATQLTANGSGVAFLYNPMCNGAACAADGSSGALTSGIANRHPGQGEVPARPVPLIG